MSDDYVREKLYVAMDCLAVSAAPIQERVARDALEGADRLSDLPVSRAGALLKLLCAEGVA